MPFLVWDSPQGRLVHELTRSIVIIGSDEVSDFRLPDPSVAKRHALVQLDDQVTITDLGSERGTKINGASLVPDLPSTLEPGDFINLGQVVLTFHLTAPPAAASPKARPAGAKGLRTAAPAKASASFPWKWVALGFAFLLVGCLGALIALSVARGDGDEEAKNPAKEKQAKNDPTTTPDANVSPDPEPKDEPQPEKEPEVPEVPKVIEEIPPNRYATVGVCPNLLEVNGVGFIPAKVEAWNASRMTAVGADGRRYRFKLGDTHRVLDRADLARRAQKRIERQPIDEIKNCFELAQWCFLRHIRAPLKPFLKRIVADRPGDPVEKFLETIESDEKG